MENALQIFQHEEFGKIRAVVIDGESWFVGKDVATALKYKDTTNALKDHVDPEDKKVIDLDRVTNDHPITDAIFAGWIKNEVTVINESGLYSMIFGSKLPKAKEFKHWVTSKVLPAIRKTGSYSSPKKEKVESESESETATEIKTTDEIPNYPILKSTIAVAALKDAVSIMKIMEQDFYIRHRMAMTQAILLVEKLNNIELDEIKDLIPFVEQDVANMTPTQLGRLIGKSPQYVNKKLIELGFQKKDVHGGRYILTEAGKEYGEEIPYENNGYCGYQIKWCACIINV